MGYVYPKGNFSHFVDFVTLSVHVFHLNFSFFLIFWLFSVLKKDICFYFNFFSLETSKSFLFFMEISKSRIKKSYFLYSQKSVRAWIWSYFAIFQNFQNSNNFFLEFFSISNTQKKVPKQLIWRNLFEMEILFMHIGPIFCEFSNFSFEIHILRFFLSFLATTIFRRS